MPSCDRESLAQLARECSDLSALAKRLGVSKDAARGRARRAGLKLSELFARSESTDSVLKLAPTHPRTIVEGSITPAKGRGVYRVIFLPDCQVPYEDDKAMRLVESYIADSYFDEIIDAGDFLDLDQVSSFNKGKLRLLEGRSIAEDFARGNAIIDRRLKAARRHNKRVKYTQLQGNHEHRLERFLDENPQFQDLVEVEVGLKFKERGIQFVRCYSDGATYKLGNAYFHHGLYTGGNHAKQHAEKWGVSIFYGHVHDVSQYSRVAWGKDSVTVGQSIGCLCMRDLQYIAGRPSNWQLAFATFSIFPDGHFTYHVTRIVDYRFATMEGRVYGWA